MVSSGSQTSVKITSELLGLQSNDLTVALTSRSMRSAGEAKPIQLVFAFFYKAGFIFYLQHALTLG